MPALRTAVLVATALAASVAGLPVEAAGATRKHEVAVAFGPSSNGPYLLASWTSPTRVGMYARMFPTLRDDHDVEPNSTVTDETAGEVGVAVRITPWLTLGAGYGRYEKVVSTYGDPDWLFGIPSFLGEETTEDAGATGMAVFTLTSRSRAAALSLSLSLSPAGSGAALGVTF